MTDWDVVFLTGLLVVVVAFSLGLALDTGDLGISAGLDPTVGPDPTATPSPVTAPPTASTGSSERTPPETTTTRAPPFRLDVVDTSECGRTCREVTVELRNNRDTAATDVVVTTRIYAGNDTTENSLIWTGQEPVGTMAAGETVTSTRRVSLGFGDVVAVTTNDNWITIVTTISSETETMTLTEREQVS